MVSIFYILDQNIFEHCKKWVGASVIYISRWLFNFLYNKVMSLSQRTELNSIFYLKSLIYFYLNNSQKMIFGQVNSLQYIYYFCCNFLSSKTQYIFFDMDFKLDSFKEQMLLNKSSRGNVFQIVLEK